MKNRIKEIEEKLTQLKTNHFMDTERKGLTMRGNSTLHLRLISVIELYDSHPMSIVSLMNCTK